jgi:hypothetical protein
VDGDEVEVGHGGTYEGRGLEIPFGKPVDKLVHESGYVLGFRAV